MADSIVRLSVEDSSFNAKIKAAAKSFADFGKNVASAGVDAFGKFARGVETASGAFKSFNAVLKANALVFVATTAIQAAQAIGEMVGDWISGASDAEEAQRKLNEEVERTLRLLNEFDKQADFHVREAKAMGKSTSEILQIRLNEAIGSRNAADSAALELPADSEAYQKLKERSAKYDELIRKIKDEIRLDEIAQQYHTGEYAIRGGRSGGGGKGINLSSIAFNTSKAALAGKKAEDNMPSVFEMIRPENLLGTSEEWEKYKDTITDSIGSIGESMENLTHWTENFDPYEEKMKEMATLARQQQMAMGLAGQAVSNFSAALSSMEDPGIKAAGTMMSAIANIALGFATASAQAGALGPFGWIAWLAAGLAAMATTISTVHNLAGFAQGGIVEGNTYSGDQIPIRANAGEVVLTRAMQGNLASQLEGNGLGNLNLTATISGEQIRLALNNNGRRTGRGEYVQTNFR